MRPSQILLRLFAESVNLPLGLSTFEERFELQKKVYLTQIMGLDMSYRFGWYLRGPYSRELTADAFTLRDLLAQGDDEPSRVVLSQRATECISKAGAFWSLPDSLQGVCEADWLELLASLHYLKHVAYWTPATEPREFDSVYRKLIKSKPRFRRQQHAAEAAWQRLNEFGLTHSKTAAEA